MLKNKHIRACLIFTTSISIFFIGCTGVETPNIGCGETPFVVGSINIYQDSLYEYTAKDYTMRFSESFSGKQSVISSDVFQIGDTLRLTK